MGIQVWPWTDQLLLETHGYCGDCYERLLEPIENGSKGPKTNSVDAQRPAGRPRRS
jgi:hypothetical protein